MNELMGYIEMFWPFLVLVAVFYFFMYRPQKKQEQERNAFLGSLKKGDHVVTAGGIYGIIRSIHGDTATLEIAPKVAIKIDKASVMKGAAKTTEEKPEEKAEKPAEPEEDAASGEDKA